jgi:glutamate-1-semialdehyde 2,1-aminomutase
LLSKPTTTRVPRSMALYARALELIPGGTQLVSRRPNRFAYGVSPIYAARAQGARFWDVDGFEYIDWISGIGAILLGYADPVVDDAVREQMSRGTLFSVNHELEVELAEELCRSIPCAEMVRYAKCGGEACAMAIRIARGTTGRDKVLFCGYHGWHDWYLAANLDAASSLNAHLFPGIEPLRSEWPPEGYLDGAARLARAHGAILIFDEVSTGLRFGTGGAQARLGVTPDMAVFAKSLSNGYPMAAVVGQRDVMEPAARMFLSSTYWSDTIGLQAALTTLRETRRRNVAAELESFGAKLKERLNRVAQETGCPVQCRGIDMHPRLEFDVPDTTLRGQVTTLYIQEMAKRGCHGYASFYLNAAQGEAELDQTLAAARDTFAMIAEAVESKTVSQRLECDPQQDAFRRLVQ